MAINKTKKSSAIRFNQGLSASNVAKQASITKDILTQTIEDKERVSTSHTNFMGGRNWDISDAVFRLEVMASSSFFGEPKYYRDTTAKAMPVEGTRLNLAAYSDIGTINHLSQLLGKRLPTNGDSALSMERAIDEALDQDPKSTLELAIRLRNEAHIRVTPQVILVRAAYHEKVRGTTLISTYGPQILRRVDDAVTGLAYLLQKFPSRKTYVDSKTGSVNNKKRARPYVPNSLKRLWREFLGKQSDYTLAKYRMENREVKTVDLIFLTHPKGESVDKLVKDQLKNTNKTWEAIISERGSNKDAWEEAFNVMGHMAMLRNIRNMLDKGIDVNQLCEALVKGAPTGKQIPFRYYSAYQAVKEKAPTAVKTALDKCMYLSLSNLPRLPGVTVSLTDNSGSAQSAKLSKMSSVSVATVGNLSGLLAALSSDEGHVGVFGDKYHEVPVTHDKSIFTQLDYINLTGKNIGGGTENGVWLFWDDAIRKGRHLDNVFMYSDLQMGHGGLYGLNPKSYSNYIYPGKNDRYIDVAKLVKVYRERVNPKVNVFMVQIAGYEDVVMPEFYPRTYVIGGWSESILHFAYQMITLMG